MALARLAANQHGVVSVPQLECLGVHRRGRSKRVASGRLFPIHRGVYAVGHQRLCDEGRWMAAVLACGDGAVLSHRSAAELWGIRRRNRRPSIAGGRGESSAVDLTIPGTAGRRKREGIALHRSSTLIARDCTRRDGIPVTKPARTLRDLHRLLSPADFAAALREAEFLRLPVGDRSGEARARTELESRMQSLWRRHRLPRPSVNVRVDRYEVDFLWPEQSLIVEVDGWESHRTRSAFEEDRARDSRLAILGYEVIRFTWRQVTGDGAGVARTIRAILRARSA